MGVWHGVAGEEHWEPLRRARAGAVGLLPLARHTGLRDVREEGGAKGRGDTDEDDRVAARSAHLCLRLSSELEFRVYRLAKPTLKAAPASYCLRQHTFEGRMY